MGQIITIQDITENKVTLDEAKTMAIMYKGEIFSYFDEGCTRFVFTNEDQSKVIKLNKDRASWAKNFNDDEWEIYQNASEETKQQMAHTQLENGFIEQEFCMPIKWAGIKLTIPQRLFALSCRNDVGWTKEGELVCFDLSEFKKY